MGRRVLLVVAVALASCRGEAPSPPGPPPSASAPPPAMIEGAWCAEGYRALDEGTCYVAPARLASPPSVVIFLHGMTVDPPLDQQATVRAAAERLGFVALVPRGKKGLCTWSTAVTSWWCWPTNQKTVDAESAGLFARWIDAEAKIEDAIGARFSRRYVLGFSNGGYFAAFLSVEALLSIDGAGVVGAGRTTVDESLTGVRRPPFYLAVGEKETEGTRYDAEHLARVLSLRGFPVEYVVHPDRGHELHEDDFESAWLTWRGMR